MITEVHEIGIYRRSIGVHKILFISYEIERTEKDPRRNVIQNESILEVECAIGKHSLTFY